MRSEHWVTFWLACIGLLPMATAPLFGPIIENSPRESTTFGMLIIGVVSACWFFRNYRTLV